MKNLFKYIGLISILLFSFYYTEKISGIVVNNSSLVMEINDKSDNFNVIPVNAIIDDDYITPGVNGKTVNVLKSYNNMKFLDTFNSYYLVFDKIVPDVSLENNKNKIIKFGNSNKQSVAIVINNNSEVINYSNNKNIKISRLVNIDTFDKDSAYEQINYDNNNYSDLDSKFRNANLNNSVCIINDNIIDVCKEKGKYLVEPSISLYNYNLANIKNNIKSGSIIYVDDNVSLSDYKILVRQIYYQDLDIVGLSKLISEERD